MATAVRSAGLIESMRRKAIRTSLLLPCVVILAILAAAAWTMASADEAEEPTLRLATVLEPGTNFIGWISDSGSTRGLFRSIPQLEAVWSYDAEARVWQRALRPGVLQPEAPSPPVPGGFGVSGPSGATNTGTLSRIEAGAGLILQLSGERPLSRWRSAVPARGMVTLHTGPNLAAWLGLNQTRLDQAVHSIGKSLQQVSVWSAQTQQFRTYRADELDQTGDLPFLDRGDAVWVNVSRPVNWLQPTGIMPRVKFPGHATADLQDRVRASIRHAMRFFRESYHIEADYSKFTIYVSDSVDALFEAITADYPHEQFERNDIESSYNSTAAFVTHGAVAMVLKPRSWTMDTDGRYGSDAAVSMGRSLAAHEYAHVLQWQLRDINGSARLKPRGDESYSHPFWMEEGNATWVEDALLVWDGAAEWAPLRDGAIASIVGLGKLEFWQDRKYTLGRAAFFDLAQRAGEDAWLELWRQAAPIQFGPQHRWSALTPWKRAFQEAFGLTFEQFEQEFEQARDAWGHQISGRVVMSPELRNAWANARLPVRIGLELNGRNSSLRQFATTDPSGAFSFRGANGEYQLSIDLGGGCSVHYQGEDGHRGLLRVAGSDIDGIEIELGADSCPSRNRNGVVLERTIDSAPADQGTVISINVQPSDKLIGWVSERQTVNELFAAIPEVRAIWAFDADLQQWRRAVRPGFALQAVTSPPIPSEVSAGTAVRAAPATTLSELKPGMGVVLQVGQHTNVSLPSSRTPARGSVTLKPGLNAAAWLGVDGTRLTDAIRGIGKSLERVAVWSDAADKYVTYDARQLATARNSPKLNRGDAVWVTVHQNVHWLQPTAVLPNIKFPGGATRTVRERVLSSFTDVLRFYRETYGVEADYSQFIVYAPSDADALIEALDTDFPSGYRNTGWIRQSFAQGTAWVENGAYAMVVPQVMWQSEYDPYYDDAASVWRGRFVTAHEYAHVLQWQLRDVGGSALTAVQYNESYDAPNWIVEGQAMRIMDAIHEWDGVTERSENYLAAFANITGLGTLEYWQLNAYELGRAAALHMESKVGADAWLEYWRQLAPTEFGPSNRWMTRTTWTDAFEVAFGQTFEEYRADFESARSRWGHLITGQITINRDLRTALGGSQLLSRLTVELTGRAEVGPDESRYMSTSAALDDNGEFAFRVANGEYQIAVDLGRCRVRYEPGVSSDGSFTVAGQDITKVELQLNAQSCPPQISGRLLDAAGTGITNATIQAFAGGNWEQSSTSDDGSFAISVPENGLVRLLANIGGCQVYFRRSSATGSYHQATVISVSDSDIRDIRWQLVDGMCELRISGTLRNADGTPRSDQWVNASGTGSGAALSESDGSFSIVVPGNGEYRLSAWTSDCWIYMGSGGPSKSDNNARRIIVTSSDVTGIDFRLPANPQAFCN